MTCTLHCPKHPHSRTLRAHETPRLIGDGVSSEHHHAAGSDYFEKKWEKLFLFCCTSGSRCGSLAISFQCCVYYFMWVLCSGMHNARTEVSAQRQARSTGQPSTVSHRRQCQCHAAEQRLSFTCPTSACMYVRCRSRVESYRGRASYVSGITICRNFLRGRHVRGSIRPASNSTPRPLYR